MAQSPSEQPRLHAQLLTPHCSCAFSIWPVLVHPLATTALRGRGTVEVGRASQRGVGAAPDVGLDRSDDLDGGEGRGDDEEEGECWTRRQGTAAAAAAAAVVVTGPGSPVAVRAWGRGDDEGGDEDEDGGEEEGEGDGDEEEEEVADENRRIKS